MHSNELITLKTGKLRNQAFILPLPIQIELQDNQLGDKGKFLLLEVFQLINQE